ncbi:MAG: hypothetical protein J6A60_03165, partial [Clostridia bacterium]|nr:hypothetical protein [Clostridia bacterium]
LIPHGTILIIGLYLLCFWVVLANLFYERIYLNFSCPYPKNRYANHRLTNPRFLKSYDIILKNGGEIHQKTDNTGFFEYSIEQLSGYGFALKNVSLDLHSSSFEGNIETEYEHRFASQGLPIYRLEAYRK